MLILQCFRLDPSADCVEVTMFITATGAGKPQAKAGRGRYSRVVGQRYRTAGRLRVRSGKHQNQEGEKKRDWGKAVTEKNAG